MEANKLIQHQYEITQIKEVIAKQSENIEKILIVTSKMEVLFEKITNIDSKREDDNVRVHKRIDKCRTDMRTLSEKVSTIENKQNKFLGAFLIFQILIVPIGLFILENFYSKG